MPTKTMTLKFVIPRASMLNANVSIVPMKKAKLARELKHMAFDEGFKHLNEDMAKVIAKRRLLIDSEENNKTIKRRLTKKLKESHPEASTKEIKQLVETEFASQGFTLDNKSSDVPFTPLFNRFHITAFVSGPTARRLDPPNLSPTTKHLIDGLTWCGFWPDDSGDQLLETGFRQAPKNDTKTSFIIWLRIDELTDEEFEEMRRELAELDPMFATTLEDD